MYTMEWKCYVGHSAHCEPVLNALCYGKYSMHTDNTRNATNNTFPYTEWNKMTMLLTIFTTVETKIKKLFNADTKHYEMKKIIDEKILILN